MSIREYWDQVNVIERRNPGELLLPSLRGGHSRVNEAYLQAALKRLPVQGDSEVSEIPEPDSEIPEFPADETLRGLWAERTRLFGEMNKLSNHFHECTTDDQRAANSNRILAVWDRIQDAKATIAYYQANNALPDPVSDEDELPDHPVALSKKLASLRARVSQKKQQIREIAALDEGTTDKQAKIDAAEGDLKRLKHMTGLAEQKLKIHEQGEG